MSTVADRLDEIAALMKKGRKAAEFQDELDMLLGTSMAERDPVVEAEYQGKLEESNG